MEATKKRISVRNARDEEEAWRSSSISERPASIRKRTI
jgi:hypothetical protein